MNTPNRPEHALAQIQRWMQTALVHPHSVEEGIDSLEAREHIDVGPEDVERILTRSRAQTALERLAVYGSAYYARLLECMREEFPVLKHALGEEVFDAFAVGYLQKHSPTSWTLMELGTHFPRFLAETRPEEEDWPDFLIDLATLERTFSEVFDGPGVEGQKLLDAQQLMTLPVDRLLEARLVPVCCLRLLALHYPVHSYLTAVRKEEDPAPPAPAETFLAVSRRRYVVRHYELSRPAHALLSALAVGEPVGQAIERAVSCVEPADYAHLETNLRTWFHDWAAEGLFSRVEVEG